jgi:predicted nucleic acid-binding protein
VFVDTCVWSSFFTKPASLEKENVDALLDEDRVAIVGPILAEVLQGFVRKEQADWVSSRLRLVHYVEVEWNDGRAAADLGRILAARGHLLPLSDLVVAVVSERLDVSLYSTDPHFDVIPGVKRFR